MSFAGRPLHSKYDELRFIPTKIGHKNCAKCVCCGSIVKNTATQRLEAHRRVCNKQTYTLNEASTLSVGDGESNIFVDVDDPRAQQNNVSHASIWKNEDIHTTNVSASSSTPSIIEDLQTAILFTLDKMNDIEVNRDISLVPQQAPPGTKQVVAPTPPVKKSLPQVSQPSPKPAITKPAPPRPVSPPQPPPPPPEVCLRWNSYHSNMQATFPSLLNNEQFVDVTLACEGRSIKCHKMMLSACSSYFEELLSQNPCQHPIVLMKDLKFWEVQALVDFMYRGEVNVGQDKLPSLLAAAEALQIKGLAGPASTSSSHDEDSLPPSLPLTADDYLDESTSSPSSARRARKRRTIAALPTPRQNTISPHRNPVGRPRLVRPSPQPSTSTSSYHQASVASEPPLRRARRSEPASLPVGQEIKVEPVDIDISNDSMDPIDDGFDMNKTYDGSSGGGGGGGGGGGSGGGGAGAGAGDVSDTSKQDDEAGGGTEGEITGNLTDDNRAIISGHDSDHMDYGNNNGMNSEATTTQAGRENSIEIQGYSYTEGSSDDPTMSSSDMNMTYPEVVLNPGAENASSDSILGHL
ncbi:protein bric-a-brac 1-like isoform X15 [Periplaneta americana]|uniref:protein bric-a-brac 1-like isoform X15 n=1 Tax=Periplaneta americana TaxID=6978 RepID=UPI0037E70F77